MLKFPESVTVIGPGTMGLRKLSPSMFDGFSPVLRKVRLFAVTWMEPALTSWFPSPMNWVLTCELSRRMSP